jgi:hypothetical protein
VREVNGFAVVRDGFVALEDAIGQNESRV